MFQKYFCNKIIVIPMCTHTHAHTHTHHTKTHTHTHATHTHTHTCHTHTRTCNTHTHTHSPGKGFDLIIYNILSYLEDPRSLCHAEQVCSDWYRVIAEWLLWKKLIKKKVKTDPLWRGLCERRGWWGGSREGGGGGTTSGQTAVGVGR